MEDMVQDLSQLTTPSANSAGSAAAPRQAVAGLMPPQLDEALIREGWPTVVAFSPGISRLGERLMKTIVLAPFAWFFLLAPLFLWKFRPFFCKRYTLTNRRLMIQRGIKPQPVAGLEVPLADIDDVRIADGTYDPFYLSGDLEVLSKGQVRLRLRGAPEPESFRHAILNAVKAWVPEKAKGPFLPASAKV
jgi:hypothetical protein